ncbi:MAG: hypothetical protein DRP64_19250 [Verrucomicrobia bacterium]|nr:MAG: hypothetical protein DRP64_19250 [Verrucomicrobiota bacterium]
MTSDLPAFTEKNFWKLATKLLNRISQANGETDTIRNILLTIKSFTRFDAVAIRLQKGEDFPYYVTKGFSDEFVAHEKFLCAKSLDGKIARDQDGKPVLECLCGSVISGRTDASKPFFTTAGSFFTNSTTKLQDSTPAEDFPTSIRNRCNQEGYESVALIPLRQKNEIIGLLQLNHQQQDAFTPTMIEFFEQLGSAIGLVLRQQTKEEQLRQAQKLEAVGRLAGGVAHDFNNILTAINGYSEMLLAGLPADDPMAEDIGMIFEAGQRAASLTEQLLALGRRKAAQTKTLALNEILERARKMLGRILGDKINLRFELSDDLWPVNADPGHIDQVLLNLAVNARDAMADGGTLFVGSENTPECVLLTVADDGGGMNEETRQRAFEPYFSTKQKAGSYGLGLSTVHGLVTQNLGSIEIGSELGAGTTVKIYLPRAEEKIETVPPAAVATSSGTETILLVEDEATVRMFTKRILERNGYRILEAAEGKEAIEVFTRHQNQIHLLLTDVIMPNMNGRELYESLQTSVPDLRVLFMSGYSADILAPNGVLDSGIHLIEKPFTAKDLVQRVRARLDQN